MGTESIIWSRGRTRAKMLGLIENKSQEAREMRESVVAMICCHGLTIRQVGREYGLSDGDVQDLLLEGMSERMNKAVKDAYRAGRLSVMPPAKVIEMPLPVERKRAA